MGLVAMTHPGFSGPVYADSADFAATYQAAGWSQISTATTQPLTLEYVGSWSSTEVYKPGDIVTYAGTSYVALAPSIAATPGAGSVRWGTFGGGAGAIAPGTYVPSPATPAVTAQRFLVAAPSLTAGVQWAFLSAAGLANNVKDSAATEAQRAVVGNGASKPLSGFYGSLGAAQAAYPIATALSDELDWAVFQTAINATPAGSVLFVPSGVYWTNKELLVSVVMTIQGTSQFFSYIKADGCNGLAVASTVSGFSLRDFGIYSRVRHATTANALIGLRIDGDTTNRPFNHVYANVYIDGFQTAAQSSYLWSSTFDNVKCNYGQLGISAYGLSVNNVVKGGCSLSVAGASSRCIIFRGTNLDGSVQPSEGWTIADSLLYGAEIGIEGVATTHVSVHDCIIDFNTAYGVLIRSGSANFGGNWRVHDNYVAMTGTASAGIADLNAIANSSNRGNRIHDNDILTYGGSTCARGIDCVGAEARNNDIHSNTLLGFSTLDINGGDTSQANAIHDNTCLSAITPNIDNTSLCHDNIGSVQYQRATTYTKIGKTKVTYDEAVPTTGTWAVGDICWKVNPAASGNPGWMCVAAGTPGTWKAMANLAA